jgi:AcrR family transcriptional regulator
VAVEERIIMPLAEAGSVPESDGRRLRSQGSRARIVQAMLDLVRGGELSPSAELVAGRAGVGLRTVFRHFNDMDSLYAEMSVVIEAELRAVQERPFLAGDWRGRVVEVVARRSEAFERIAPFKRASDVHRHRSRFLEVDHRRLVDTSRAILAGLLPEALAREPAVFEALDLLLGFESWSRLRREQRLDVAEARVVLEAAVRRLID